MNNIQVFNPSKLNNGEIIQKTSEKVTVIKKGSIKSSIIILAIGFILIFIMACINPLIEKNFDIEPVYEVTMVTEDNNTITDTVHVDNLLPNTNYEVSAKLYDRQTGKEVEVIQNNVEKKETTKITNSYLAYKFIFYIIIIIGIMLISAGVVRISKLVLGPSFEKWFNKQHPEMPSLFETKTIEKENPMYVKPPEYFKSTSVVENNDNNNENVFEFNSISNDNNLNITQIK